MRQDIARCHSRELRAELLPRLLGSVFHVTTASALPSIMKDSRVRSDAGTPRFANAWCRSLGYVSVCDLRKVEDEHLNLALDRYNFLDPFGNEAPAFLFLLEDAHSNLISWREQMASRALDKLVVPYIEACFPGDIPLTAISHGLVADIERDPPDPHLEALRKFGRRGPPT